MLISFTYIRLVVRVRYQFFSSGVTPSETFSDRWEKQIIIRHVFDFVHVQNFVSFFIFQGLDQSTGAVAQLQMSQ